MIELLSPAGNITALNAAIKNGADSVYIGIQGYNMRATISNFSIEELEYAVKQCHDSGVKIYVCTNTIMKERDLIELDKIMPLIKSSGVDAVIISDLGALDIARENGLNIHMSVQANLSNSKAINLLQKLGVTRVILSREMSLKEIKEITNNTTMDIEVFVHGSMCVAISGRCFLSSHLYNKSANCGECLQPCRKDWKIVSEDGEEYIISNESDFQNHNLEYEPVSDDFRYETHILSTKDLCMVEHIPELIEAGIKAFKIEGRAKPAEYVSTVTKIYRDAINMNKAGKWNSQKQININKWKLELKKVFNRGFDTGFFYKVPDETSNSNQATYVKKDSGMVVNYYNKVNAAEIRLWEDLEIGDEIIIQGKTTGSITLKISSMQIDGKNIIKASKGQNVAIFTEENVRPNDNVYKRLKKDV
ncbi:MAG: U32 family peptidase [Methanobacterium sp.]|nr:U32 family peptidase [Methanobacterium sp.]